MSKLKQVIGIGLLTWACGCGGGNGGNGGGAPVTPHTVSAANIVGVGDVLVDSGGNALYSPDEEASGVVLCVDTCTSIWKPLEPGPDAPTAAPGTTTLGVVDRPDGTQQVTGDAHPLYTFVNDSPGEVTGNGATDDFGGQHFTWHAVLADGGGSNPTPTPPSPPSGGYGY